MKKNAGIILSFIMVLHLVTGCSGQNAPQKETGKLTVYTSFYPMYDFASKIGGDKISLSNMVPAGTEPHDWEPTAADITNLEKADVFIYNGVGLEHWTESVLGSLQNKNLIVVETAKNLSLLDGSHDEEDQAFDPHVWLSPIKAKAQMESIRDAFVQSDPENSSTYDANFTRYAAELDSLDAEFKDTLSPLPNKNVIVAHEAFGYLCEAYGLNQVGIEGLSPDSEPDPARMAEIIDFAKGNDINTIFFEELVSPKVAQTIADAIGAKTAVLNPIEGLSDEQLAANDDYFSIMRQNLEVLKQALQ